MRYGAGAGASRLVSGNMRVHRLLEQQIADFKGSAACVLFGSGYLANAGVIPALVRKGEVVFSDAAQPRQRGRRLPARRRRDVRLQPRRRGAPGLGAPPGGRPRQPDRHRRRLLDGRRRRSAPGDRRAGRRLRRPRDGRRGPRHRHHRAGRARLGRGRRPRGRASTSWSARSASRSAPTGRSPVAARRWPSTSSTPPGRSSTPPRCRLPRWPRPWPSLELLREQPRRVDKLQRNAWILREALAEQGLPVELVGTHIVPLVVGEADAAMTACERALGQGVFAQAIRPPTVPEGTSRLRLSVMASHTKSELKEAAKKLATAVRPAVQQPEMVRPRRLRDRVSAASRDRAERERAAQERSARKAERDAAGARQPAPVAQAASEPAAERPVAERTAAQRPVTAQRPAAKPPAPSADPAASRRPSRPPVASSAGRSRATPACSTSSATWPSPAGPVRHGYRHRGRKEHRRGGRLRGPARARRGRDRLQARGHRPRRPARRVAARPRAPGRGQRRGTGRRGPLPLRPGRLAALGRASWPVPRSTRRGCASTRARPRERWCARAWAA